MSNSTDRTIARRTFLRGAASLVGASALGLPAATLSAIAEPLPLGSPSLAVMFWDGTSLVAADSLAMGDLSLASVQLTFYGFGQAAEIRHIDVHPAVRTALGRRDAVFYAWTAPPNGVACTRCVMPVDVNAGLTVSTRILVDGSEEDATTAFVVAKSSGPKLLEGEYVLCAAPGILWKQFEIVSGPDGARLVSRVDRSAAPFQHVVLTVVRA
ncbi:MAG TPA: hypothetical protein VHE55_09835 [Fimbriimonadaceae bacterium]|nr:hypothetical protein [Fimbriimonadaceae bacterium]